MRIKQLQDSLINAAGDKKRRCAMRTRELWGRDREREQQHLKDAFTTDKKLSSRALELTLIAAQTQQTIIIIIIIIVYSIYWCVIQTQLHIVYTIIVNKMLAAMIIIIAFPLSAGLDATFVFPSCCYRARIANWICLSSSCCCSTCAKLS